MLQTQSTARRSDHSGVDGGRSHDGDLADDIRGKTDRGEEQTKDRGRDGTQMTWAAATESQLQPRRDGSGDVDVGAEVNLE